MNTIEDMKNVWNENQGMVSLSGIYDRASLIKVFKSRVRKETVKSIKYFWTTLALQLTVYTLLGHVIVKYWSNPDILLLTICGVLLFLPFTWVLVGKLRSIVKSTLNATNGASLRKYVLTHDSLMRQFYQFKKRYELFLLPQSCFIGVFITFKLYIPGGVSSNLTAAAMAFAITLLTCVITAVAENKKSFDDPLQNLQEILSEFKEEY